MAKLVAEIEFDSEDGNRRSLLVIGELGAGEDGSVRILGCISATSGAAVDLPRNQERAAKDALFEEEERMDLAIAEAHRVGLEEGRARMSALLEIVRRLAGGELCESCGPICDTDPCLGCEAQAELKKAEVSEGAAS